MSLRYFIILLTVTISHALPVFALTIATPFSTIISNSENIVRGKIVETHSDNHPRER